MMAALAAVTDSAKHSSREPSMNLDYVSIGRNPPEEVNAIIEVPIGGEPIKYEMDKKAGTLIVDRFLYTPMRYPGNYGSKMAILATSWLQIPANHPWCRHRRAADRCAQDDGGEWR
jgi:hypothetical protein